MNEYKLSVLVCRAIFIQLVPIRLFRIEFNRILKTFVKPSKGSEIDKNT